MNDNVSLSYELMFIVEQSSLVFQGLANKSIWLSSFSIIDIVLLFFFLFFNLQSTILISFYFIKLEYVLLLTNIHKQNLKTKSLYSTLSRSNDVAKHLFIHIILLHVLILAITTRPMRRNFFKIKCIRFNTAAKLIFS